MKRKKVKIFITIVVICLSLLFFGYQRVQHFANTPLTLQQETLFTLPVGTGRVALNALLLKDKLITDSRLLTWLWRFEPKLAKFKAGTYRLTPGMSLREMLELLVSGKEAQFSIQFIEGRRLSDWLLTLQQADYITHQLTGKSTQEIAQLLGLKSTEPLEGWLYPDTSFYTAGTSDLSLLQRSYTRMKKVVEEIWQHRDPSLPYETPYDLVNIASIIEKESAVDDERSKIASVFVNRMRKGMRLQSDPTVIYGLGERYHGTITRSALKTATPYNTYLIPALPPTPITMPSLASLQAAAHPEKTAYLYFVADGQGGHTFSDNLVGHHQAVQVYRQQLKRKNER